MRIIIATWNLKVKIYIDLFHNILIQINLI
jgi:hypothetical protein